MADAITKHSSEWAVWAQRGARILQEAFADTTAEGPTAAELVYGAMPDGQMVTAASVAQTARNFLASVFATR